VDAKLAEAKRVAETMAAEERLAETKRAAEKQAAETRLAEAKHAAEMQAAEAKLMETQRAYETTLAQAKLAQAKLAQAKLDDARHAAEAKLREPSPDLKPTYPRYGSCDTCGTITSISTRAVDRGANGYEVRVHFGTGSNWVFVYPTDPGFSSGDRVRVQSGRLMRM
jgi:hypothetical protein